MVIFEGTATGNDDNDWEVQEESRYFYEYDQQGRVVQSLQESRSPDSPSWQPVYQVEREFDGNGNIIYELQRYPNGEVRITSDYDHQNRLLKEDIQFRPNGEEIFTPESLSESIYDEDNNLIYSFSGYQWDKQTGEFTNKSITYRYYDDKNQMSRRVNEYFSQNFIRKDEFLYEWTCDGNESVIQQNILDSNDPSLIGNKTRTRYFYTHQPPCARGSIAGEEVHIYPNPASNFIDFVIPEAEFLGIVTVTDLSGKIIEQIQSMDQGNYRRIDVSQYPAGLYILHIRRPAYSTSARFTVVK